MFTSRQQREVFHLLFLERLLKVSDPRAFVLKGGINLRFFYGSPRFSEDMDLDVLAGAVDALRKNGFRILQDPAFARTLATYGIDELIVGDPAKAKQTATTQRFRARLVTTAGETHATKVEFSRRAAVGESAVATLDPGSPGDAGSLAAAERDRAMESLLGLTYADYAGQVLDFLEPAERERFAGKARWAEVVERSFALLEASPPGETGAAP